MKLFRNVVLALTALTFVATSSALAADTAKKVVKGEDQEMTFDPEEINTKQLQPITSIDGVIRRKATSLIQIRWDFIEKILQSTHSI